MPFQNRKGISFYSFLLNRLLSLSLRVLRLSRNPVEFSDSLKTEVTKKNEAKRPKTKPTNIHTINIVAPF